MFSFFGLISAWSALLLLWSPCAVAMASHQPGLAKRCRWETSGEKIGMELSDKCELALQDGSSIHSLQMISSDTLNPAAKGIVFVTMTSMRKLLKLETTNPCVAIVKGFQIQQLIKWGFEKTKLQQAILVLKDSCTMVVEPRAVTLVNLCDDPACFIFKNEEGCEITVPDLQSVHVIFEIRKATTSDDFWRAFSDSSAFSRYTSQIIEKEDPEGETTFFPTVPREGYVFRRALIPAHIRDQVYAHSGFKGITVKSLRQTNSPHEDGLELIRVPETGKSLHEIWHQGHTKTGWLGAFSSAKATYIRSTDAKLSEMRAFWLPDDPRWTANNRDLKLTKFFKVQGFVVGIQANDATKIMHEKGWNMVVLRTFQNAELSTLVVGSNSDPPQLRFTTNLGSLLITPLEAQDRGQIARQKFAKDQSLAKAGTAEKKGDTTPSTASSSSNLAAGDPWASAAHASTSNRIDAMEKKFVTLSAQVEKLEKGQETTKEQISTLKASQDSGFKQLLDAIADLKLSKPGESLSSTPVPSPAPKVAKYH